MGRPSRFSPEVRERAVRQVTEQRPAHPSEWAALQAVSTKLGTTAETLRNWMRQAERDTGQRPGLTTDDERARAVGGVGARECRHCHTRGVGRHATTRTIGNISRVWG